MYDIFVSAPDAQEASHTSWGGWLCQGVVYAIVGEFAVRAASDAGGSTEDSGGATGIIA